MTVRPISVIPHFRFRILLSAFRNSAFYPQTDCYSNSVYVGSSDGDYTSGSNHGRSRRGHIRYGNHGNHSNQQPQQWQKATATTTPTPIAPSATITTTTVPVMLATAGYESLLAPPPFCGLIEENSEGGCLVLRSKSHIEALQIARN